MQKTFRIGDVVSCPGDDGIGMIRSIKGAVATVILDIHDNITKTFFITALSKAPLADAAAWREIN